MLANKQYHAFLLSFSPSLFLAHSLSLLHTPVIIESSDFSRCRLTMHQPSDKSIMRAKKKAFSAYRQKLRAYSKSSRLWPSGGWIRVKNQESERRSCIEREWRTKRDKRNKDRGIISGCRQSGGDIFMFLCSLIYSHILASPSRPACLCLKRFLSHFPLSFARSSSSSTCLVCLCMSKCLPVCSTL